MPVLILFAGMLGLMFMRVFLPVGAKIRGQPLKTVSLSFMERALMQRVNVYALGVVLLLTTVTGVIATTWELSVVMFAFGILLLPVRYVITTEGVAVNNVVFRPWDEFTGYVEGRRGIRLTGQPGTRSLTLSLLPGKQQEVLPTLRRCLKSTSRGSDRASRTLVRQAR